MKSLYDQGKRSRYGIREVVLTSEQNAQTDAERELISESEQNVQTDETSFGESTPIHSR
jgi:hypothetical protein